MKEVMRCIIFFFITALAVSQEISLRMNSLTAVNVTMEEVSYRMKKAIRLKEMEQGGESIAIVNGLHFSNGTIVIELAGSTIPSASPTARGFIGIAFRVQHRDSMRYDCFYLRPKNGRDIDQLRRNHSAQYIAHPSFTWQYLRKEYPGKYESYVDLVDGEWTKIKIQVKGEEAKLFVHNADQPALIINKLHNTESGGGIALWIGQETDGYFRNLKISKH